MISKKCVKIIRWNQNQFLTKFRSKGSILGLFFLDTPYNCCKWALLMKFRMMKPTRSAGYVYEKLQFSVFRCFEHYLKFILDLFLEEYKDIHGINNKFHTWIVYNCCKWAILMKFRMIKPTGSARYYAYEKVAISRILQISSPVSYTHLTLPTILLV